MEVHPAVIHSLHREQRIVVAAPQTRILEIGC